MSLGLDDVSKRRKAPRAAASSPSPSPKREAARPWSTAGLARHGVSRRNALGKDGAMSDEWSELHEALLTADPIRRSRLAWAQELIQERIHRLIEAPRGAWMRVKNSLPSWPA